MFPVSDRETDREFFLRRIFGSSQLIRGVKKRQKSGPQERSVEKHVQAIKRQTRRKFLAEEKNRIILEGLRGEYSIAELCRGEAETNVD